MHPESIIWRILEVESRAGRLEGAFAADPELGLMWRSQVVLTEACRSIGLEDVHVQEGDVIFRHLENRLTETETARGAAAAVDLMKVMATPGDIATDPERVLWRAWRAAGTRRDGSVDVDLDEIAARIRSEIGQSPTPIMGALRVATVFRFMTESQAPAVDRLIFMATEHSLRGGGRTRELTGQGPAALLGRIDAGWIACPSIALTQGAFRAWSPGSQDGYLDLVGGIGRDLDRALGALPMLRRWREEARRLAAGRSGKSRQRDLVELAIREPVLTSSHVRSSLGCSERSSLYLLKEAEEDGILTLITPRKSYRVWAVPMMAQLMRLRSNGSSRMPTDVHRRGAGEGHREDLGETVSEQTEERLESPVPHEESWEERSEKVLAELDAAMAQADAVLARYRQPREDR